jgi:hypothetical protein
MWHSRNQAVAFTAIHEQLFPLLCYYRIRDLSSVALLVTCFELKPEWHKWISVLGNYVEN